MNHARPMVVTYGSLIVLYVVIDGIPFLVPAFGKDLEELLLGKSERKGD